MSTKCQYRPTISTGNDASSGSLSAYENDTSDNSMRMPITTCAPWKPVSTKNVDPNRFVLRVSPSCTNVVNSYTCPPTNVIPRSAVAKSQMRIRPKSRFCAAASARTIVSDDPSNTNDDTDVYGMSKTSCGNGPSVPR